MNCTCKLCDREFSQVKYLSKHLTHTHNVIAKEYYDTYYRKPDEGFCVVCGTEVPFNRFGYHTKSCSVECSNKLRFPVTLEFWKAKGLSDEAALIKLTDVQSRFSKQVKNRKSNTTLQYFLDKGLSETDARSALRNRQSTKTLEKAIAKYGNIDGPNIWANRNKTWSSTVEAKYKNGEFIKTPKTKVWRVTSISELELAESLQYSTNSQLLFGENQLTIFDGNRNYYYDICDPAKRKIIEYNGDYWHANPSKYAEDQIVHSNKTAKQIWESDANKLAIIKALGYNVLIIWESEYLKNKKDISLACLNFINGK